MYRRQVTGSLRLAAAFAAAALGCPLLAVPPAHGSRNVLLTNTAHADSIPDLEILANDVRCTHAAAIAQIDREQLFYLRSHGLPEPQAHRLVIEGFLEAIVERFKAGPVRDAVSAAIERRLALVLGS